MQIQVLYFAIFRDRLKLDEESLELRAGATVNDALEALAERHEIIAALRGRFQVAVNQEMTPKDTVIHDGDELALIPPVAGGTGSTRHVRIVEEAPSLDRCTAAVSGREMGGMVTFTGMVRRQSRGVEVVRLEYEAYGAMAVKVMTELIDAIETEVPGCRVAVEHRVGTLAVGDIAVVIAAAAPHRAEAFQACRLLIDRLKESVPIWKKEFSSDGDEWVGLGP